LSKYGRADIAKNAVEKSDLLQSTLDFVTKSLPDLLADKYDLVANITDLNVRLPTESDQVPALSKALESALGYS
jgi:hypothetical protein